MPKIARVEMRKIDVSDDKHSEKRCRCEYCTYCSKVRGVIRRGDKKEMRTAMRDLLDRHVELGQEMRILKSFTAHIMGQIMGGDDSEEEKADTIQ